ncbi:hypothetical protein D3C77_431460 [compost metagenome]
MHLVAGSNDIIARPDIRHSSINRVHPAIPASEGSGGLTGYRCDVGKASAACNGVINGRHSRIQSLLHDVKRRYFLAVCRYRYGLRRINLAVHSRHL